jgi:hypothetical protein
LPPPRPGRPKFSQALVSGAPRAGHGHFAAARRCALLCRRRRAGGRSPAPLSPRPPAPRVQELGLLSKVQELGLLSKLEASGLTLSKIEESGLLTNLEKSGVLSLIADK